MKLLDALKNLFLFGAFAGIIGVGVLSMLSLTPISYESTQKVVNKEPEVLGIANQSAPQSNFETVSNDDVSNAAIFSSARGQIVKFYVTLEEANQNQETNGITMDMRNDTLKPRGYVLRAFPIAHNVSSFNITIKLNGKKAEERVMLTNKIFESEVILQPHSSLSLNIQIEDLIVGIENQNVETEFQFEALLKDEN